MKNTEMIFFKSDLIIQMTKCLTYSQDLLRSLGITGESTVDGAVFRGAEMIYNYERLLRQVRD